MILAKGNRNAAREGCAKEVQSGTSRPFREGGSETTLRALTRAGRGNTPPWRGRVESSKFSDQSVGPTIPLREEPFQENALLSLVGLSLEGWLSDITQKNIGRKRLDI